MFKKLAEVSLTTWIAIAALAALAAILLAVSRKQQKWTAKMIANGALAIALSFVLSCIRLYRMPTGGSVTLASMLPLMLFILDYLLAFAALGLAGIAHNKSDKWMYIGIPVAALGRAVSAILAGLMWVAGSAPEDLVIGSTQFSSPLLYSIVYNGTYLVPDTLICLVLAFLVGKQLVKVMKRK